MITGTAEAMLPARLKDDPKAFARISHAVRSTEIEGAFFRIDSTNLDQLAKASLPSITGQIDNLLKWVAEEVQDDRFGVVEIGDGVALSAIVGVVDSDRLHDLESHMAKDGLIEFVGAEGVQLTPRGWARLTPPAPPQPVAGPSARASARDAEPLRIEVCECPNCGGPRRAEVLHTATERHDGDPQGLVYLMVEVEVLRCCGCRALYIRETKSFSEDEEDEWDEHTGEWTTVLKGQVRMWPTAARRNPPNFLPSIDDQAVQQLLAEVYQALDQDLRTLAAMGVRAVLDRTFELAGAEAGANFGDKLKSLTRQHVISPAECEALKVMIDAGSAASHRGWRPSHQDLDDILSAAEAVLYRVCVQPAITHRIKGAVPPRPKPAKAGGAASARLD